MMPMGSDLGDSDKNLEGRKSVALTARANMCGSIGVTGNPSSANSLPGCAIALRNPRRLCAATGTQCHQSSAGLGSSPILKDDYQRRSSSPMREPMSKRQRTVESRFVACATVPRDF